MVENEQMKAMQEKIQNQEKAEKIWNERKQKNIKKYPIYRMFAWDLLFYYSIIYLFLTIEKGLTPVSYTHLYQNWTNRKRNRFRNRKVF